MVFHLCFIVFHEFLGVLQPVAQLYGQVHTDWNQCFVIDYSLSHPAGHKPFIWSHSVFRNTCLNIRDHSKTACSRHIYECCSSCTFRSWWTAHSA